MADTSFAELLLRLVVSLGVVVGLMVVAARVARRYGRIGGLPVAGGRRAPSVRIEVLARQPLGRTGSIAVVRAGGRDLILGVTEAQITVLAEADPLALALDESDPEPARNAAAGSSKPAWMATLEALRDRTARRS